jgi:hypothetical protein
MFKVQKLQQIEPVKILIKIQNVCHNLLGGTVLSLG